MAEAPPPISVVSVVWNHGAFLDACAASVLGQEGPAFSWVVLDNGSEDDTAERLRAWAARDRRVVPVFSPANLRQTGGLVRALEEVRSPFVALLDGDDVAAPGRLARSLAWLEEDPRRIGLYGGCEFIDTAGEPIPSWFIAQDAGALRRMAEFDMPAVHSTSAWRTDWLRQHAPLALGTGHDYVLLLYALESGEVGRLPEVLARYRVHAGGYTQRKRLAQYSTGAAIGLWHAQRRAGREEPLAGWLEWAERCSGQARSVGDIHFLAARQGLEKGLSRLALYHARRALRRGSWAAAGIIGRVLANPSADWAKLWPVLRGGYLAGAHVDRYGRSRA
ncbi:MAG TPA: glycosyltransferase family A protein [Opitutaceae bacterium]|nr:glycosyltransferase family A protein [Lacunisphaera sp.]HWA10478.1 glycosyltransferase family A protein [Opitutaceae bacterium]